MSGLAQILLKENFQVSGSDAKESALTKQLEEKGAVLYYGQRASNIDDSWTWWSTQPLSIRITRNMQRLLKDRFPCSHAPSFWGRS